MLVLSYIPNSPKVIITTSTITAGTAAVGTTAFGSILLTRYFSNCCNRSSDCVTRRSI